MFALFNLANFSPFAPISQKSLKRSYNPTGDRDARAGPAATGVVVGFLYLPCGIIFFWSDNEGDDRARYNAKLNDIFVSTAGPLCSRIFTWGSHIIYRHTPIAFGGHQNV
jgi:hypothetical protein